MIIIVSNEIFTHLKKNKIKKLDIIPLDKNINMYLFVNDENIKIKHPFTNYYFSSEDLSINFKCSLKWIRCNYSLLIFFINVLNNSEFKTFNFESIFKNNNTIQSLNFLKNIKNEKHVLTIHIRNKNNKFLTDKFEAVFIVYEVFNIDLFIENLNNINNEHHEILYSENDLIEFKLKLNILEYLSLSSRRVVLMFEISKNN